MIYIMSDIHGQYNRFKNLLHQLNLQNEDKLYILGDVVDRGPHPMKILQYMMKHQNIIHIIGNHEVMALPNLKLLVPKATGTGNFERLFTGIVTGRVPEFCPVDTNGRYRYHSGFPKTANRGTAADRGIHRIISSIREGNDKRPGILAGTRRP